MPIEPVVRAAGRKPTIIPKPRRWGRRRVTRVEPTGPSAQTRREPESWEKDGITKKQSWLNWLFGGLFGGKRKRKRQEPPGPHLDTTA